MNLDNLQKPSECQGHRSKVKDQSHMVFMCFCVHDTVVTRGQYLWPQAASHLALPHIFSFLCFVLLFVNNSDYC